MKLSSIIENSDGLGSSAITKIMALTEEKNIRALGLDPKKIISFGGGWVNHPAPEGLRASYKKITARKDLFHASGAYSAGAGILSLQELLARVESGVRGAKGVSAENIVVGQSSSELTYSLFAALLDPQDIIAFFDPTYPNYLEQACLYQRERRVVRIKAFDPVSWSYRPEEAIMRDLQKTLREKKPKLLLFASPDNPTGHLFSDEFIRNTLRLAEKVNCFVAIDLAYADLYYTARRPEHFSLSPADHKNLIKIYSHSKWSRSLGRRLGWVVAPAPVARALQTVQQALILSPDTLHQMALADYLEGSLRDGSFKKYLNEIRMMYKKAAAHTAACIDASLGFKYLIPKGGLYITANVGVDAEAFCQKILQNTGVIFIPGGGFGETLTQGIRISFGPLVNNPALIQKGMEMVGRFLRKT